MSVAVGAKHIYIGESGEPLPLAIQISPVFLNEPDNSHVDQRVTNVAQELFSTRKIVCIVLASISLSIWQSGVLHNLGDLITNALFN